jgi:hypothetical protein
MACRHMIAFYPCLFSSYVGEVLCLVCGGCGTDIISDLRMLHLQTEGGERILLDTVQSVWGGPTPLFQYCIVGFDGRNQ